MPTQCVRKNRFPPCFCLTLTMLPSSLFSKALFLVVYSHVPVFLVWKMSWVILHFWYRPKKRSIVKGAPTMVRLRPFFSIVAFSKQIQHEHDSYITDTTRDVILQKQHTQTMLHGPFKHLCTQLLALQNFSSHHGNTRQHGQSDQAGFSSFTSIDILASSPF